MDLTGGDDDSDLTSDTERISNPSKTECDPVLRGLLLLRAARCRKETMIAGARECETTSYTRWLPYLLVTLVLAVFGQVWQFQFLNLDDNVYVTENPVVRGGLTLESLVWAFDGFHDANWIPLVWLSLMGDTELFGDYAGGFHLTNVAIHAVNSVLVFLLMFRLSEERGKSFVVAALFAVHPLHVESVAWVAERKDVLSSLFGFLSLLAYVRYVKRRSPAAYVAAWTAMAASLMAKQMLVTLPFVLLLLDYWPLARYSGYSAGGWPRPQGQEPGQIATGSMSGRRLLCEKIPFLALSAVFTVIAYLAQASGGATEALEPLAPGIRLANAVVAYGGYLAKCVWPAGLSVFYPHPGSMPTFMVLLGSASVLLLVTVAAILQRRTRPFLLVGWLWYLGTLVPVIGLVQVGWHSMADRYTYFPAIGVFISVTWLIPSLLQTRWAGKAVLPALAATVLCVLSVAACRQVGYWRNSVTLFEHALEVNDENWLAHATLGAALLSNPERWDDAERHLRDAIRIRPSYATAYFNLGLLLSDRGQLHEANLAFRRSLERKPYSPDAHYFLTLNALRLGDTEESQKHLKHTKAILGTKTEADH